MPQFTEHKAKRLSDTIWDKLENDSEELNEWEEGFLEDIMNKISKTNSLTQKQYDRLLDIIGTSWL